MNHPTFEWHFIMACLCLIPSTMLSCLIFSTAHNQPGTAILLAVPASILWLQTFKSAVAAINAVDRKD